MAYRRLVLTRWTRRDRLAVLTIALTLAFFTSTVLAVTAISTQTTEIAADQGSSTSVEYVADPPAEPAGGGSAIPVTTIAVDGTNATLLGLSNRSVDELRAAGVRVPVPPDSGASVEGEPPAAVVTVRSSSGTTQSLPVESRPASQSSIPADWYVSNERVVRGAPGDARFEIRRNESATVPPDGTPLRGALAFFVAGTQSLATLLLAVAVGTGVLVAVVVYSVVRMTVRDRRDEIRVVRAVGASPRQVVGLFGGRALLLTGVGLALGYLFSRRESRRLRRA
jgi:hypothetical protein